jgi:hypothetical protein
MMPASITVKGVDYRNFAHETGENSGAAPVHPPTDSERSLAVSVTPNRSHALLQQRASNVISLCTDIRGYTRCGSTQRVNDRRKPADNWPGIETG